MSWISEYLRETVTITPKGTMGDSGRYAFDGTAVTTSARVSDSKHIVRTTGKDEVVSDRDFWLNPDESLSIGDRITWDSVYHEVVQINKPRDLAGDVMHIRVWTRVIR